MAIPEPFGGLLILAVIAASFVIGLLVIITGLKHRNRVLAGFGIICAPWFLIAFLALLSPGIDEWNPILDSDAYAWGTWEGEGYKIVLNSDSTFTADLKGKSMNGNWRRMDFNLYLSNDANQERYMRFVIDSGELLLLPDPPRDEPTHPGPITRKR